MQHRRKRLVRAFAALAVLGLIAAACGSSSKKADNTTTTGKANFPTIPGVPGVSDTEIHFSLVATSTAKNPTGECSLECFADGIKAYFAYRNSQGGIYGRKLVLDTGLDDELGKGQEKALQVLASKNSLATFLYTLIATPYATFADKNWPVYGYLTDHVAMAGKTSLFSTYSVSAFDVPRIDQVFIPKSLGATKIATIGYGVGSSQTCVDQTVNAFKTTYASTGIKVVYSNKTLAFGLSNGVAPEVTAMKNAGVQVVFTCTEANGLKTFAQEMKRQGLTAPLVTYSGFEDDFITANASVLEGSIEGLRVLPDIATSAPGLDLFHTWTKKTSANVKFTTRQGWGAADEMFQGLKKAGENFDQTKLIAGTNSLRWDADGMFAPIDVGRQHVGQSPNDAFTHGDNPHCFVYLQVKSGKLTFMKPETKDKPFACWPQAHDFNYTEPTAESFG